MIFLLWTIYVVLVIAPIYLLFMWFKAEKEKKRIAWLQNIEFTTLVIEVPKNNEKSPLAAEQMFASLHGIFSESRDYQYHLSFEVISVDKFVQFYLRIPKQLVDFVEGQIYAQYPTVEINRVEDYIQNIDMNSQSVAGCELVLTKPEVYPIKLFSDFEVDPLSGITSVISKVDVGESVWLQILIRPVGDEWQEKGIKTINAVRGGKSTKKSRLGVFAPLVKGLGSAVKNLVILAINPDADINPEKPEVKLSGPVDEALKTIEYKIAKLGFATKIRVLTVAKDPITAESKISSVAAAFKQFNTTNGNGFKSGPVKLNDRNFVDAFVKRSFDDSGYILNISELAAVYHLPHQTVATPHIVWAGSKKGEPPANLPLIENFDPLDITILGETNFRNVYRKFGIKLDDRRRHTYIIGKSGVGKSVLMENMAIDDIREGRGVIIVDPHGEFAEKAMSCVPDERIEDVIVFDPSDRMYPIGFNLLEKVDDDFKGMVASGFVGIFKKIFGDSWGPRLEHILRNTVLALLDYEDSTMLDIPRMLTEKRFREKVVEVVKDPVIREFWTAEFAQYDNKFRTEAVSPILNKVGQFLSTATIRNIVGQPKSMLNIREIMDTRKILLINLSRGKIGEDNSALLGAMMITKIQLAAMARADVTVDKRPDSYLYVDEFQNFATDSFAVILSEARKYNLNLIIANQYVTQMPETVREAVFGNAGTIISFRIGGADADFLVKEFEPVFEANDLVNLDKYHIYVKLLIDGISKPAFSARTLPPVAAITGNKEKIIDFSRQKYSKERAVVEDYIAQQAKDLEDELKNEVGSFVQGKRDNVSNYNSPARPPVDVRDSKMERPTANATTVSDEPAVKEDKPRVMKWQNIIGNNIYKEQTARGGVKWYIGQEIDPDIMADQNILIDENGKKMIDIMEKVYDKKIKKTGESIAEKKDEKKVEEKIEPPAEPKAEKSDNKIDQDKTPKQAEEKPATKTEEPKVVEEKTPDKADNSNDKDDKPIEEGQVVNLE